MKISLADGVTFEGNFRNGEPRGTGTKTGPNYILKGWFNGYDNVSGRECIKKYWSSAGVFQYRGCLRNSQIHGQGEFKWPDGRKYLGEFLEGTMNGKYQFCFVCDNCLLIVM